jgi:hypothetical protein
MIETEKGIIVEEVKGRMTSQDVEKEKQLILYCQKNKYEYRMITKHKLDSIANYKKLLKDTKLCDCTSTRNLPTLLTRS